MSAFEGHIAAGTIETLAFCTELDDEDDARVVAALMARVVTRECDRVAEHEAMTGQVPLAARGGARFAPVFVVPALQIGRLWGDDVSAWMLGYEDRTFLRLVNVEPDEAVARILSTSEGRIIRPERRLRAELPFALDELAEDRVYELVPSIRPGEAIRTNLESDWTMPHGSYDGRRERKVLREGWEDWVEAYGNAATANQTMRRTRAASALRRLLFTDEAATKPRRLRPWALLTLQSMAAEILKASPRRADAFGIGLLRQHPQCYPSLVRRLRKA